MMDLKLRKSNLHYQKTDTNLLDEGRVTGSVFDDFLGGSKKNPQLRKVSDSLKNESLRGRSEGKSSSYRGTLMSGNHSQAFLSEKFSLENE